MTRRDGHNGGAAVDVPSVTGVTGTGVPIRGNDIDTDQIIPARFLKVVTFEGLGEFAFFDQRYDEDDTPTDHPMNQPRYQGANIMVVNGNFGCGSSREHAPQALLRWGIDALIGESFAEIFAGNCLTLGIPTVTAPSEQVERLQNWVEENPDGTIHIDIEDERVTYGDSAPDASGADTDGDSTPDASGGDTAGSVGARSIDVTVDEGQRKALVEGIWDTTALMRSNQRAIEATAAELPYVDRQGREP